MKESVVISNADDCIIELIHRRSNPTSWIVKRSKRTFWYKHQISSDWFIDGQQARRFAEEMKRDHEESGGRYAAKEIPRREK